MFRVEAHQYLGSKVAPRGQKLYLKWPQAFRVSFCLSRFQIFLPNIFIFSNNSESKNWYFGLKFAKLDGASHVMF
jgi:hypothetical protein